MLCYIILSESAVRFSFLVDATEILVMDVSLDGTLSSTGC